MRLETGPGAPAPWRQIRAEALRRIQTGDWRPGDQIPNEEDLAAACGCNRSTVSRALRDLAAAGFLERRRKGGTRVAPNPVRKAPLEVPIIGEAIRRRGACYGYRLLERRVGPDPAAAAALGVPRDRPLALVRALHLADDRPHQLETRWINPAAAPGIASADVEAEGVDVWLLANAPLTRAAIRITAEAATAQDAVTLAAPAGAALLLVERTSWSLTAPISWLRLLHAPGCAIETAL